MDRFITSVTITDEALWINGQRITDLFWIHEDGPTFEWVEEIEGNDQGVQVGVLNVPFLIFSDTTIVSDLRAEKPQSARFPAVLDEESLNQLAQTFYEAAGITLPSMADKPKIVAGLKAVFERLEVTVEQPAKVWPW